MQRNGLKRCPAGGGPDPAQPDRKWEAPSPTISGAVTAQIGRQPRALRLLARWATPEHAAAQGAALLPRPPGGPAHAPNRWSGPWNRVSYASWIPGSVEASFPSHQ